MNNHYNFVIPVIDTDSLTISKPDGSAFTQQEINKLTEEINELTEELINWEFEFYIPQIIVIKSKNYILDYGQDKLKIKGSSLKDAKKEVAMRSMMEDIIKAMLQDKHSELVNIYHSYIKEALNVKDISRWCSKKTVTEAVLDCKTNKDARKNERDIWDAVKNDNPQAGDKILTYPIQLAPKITTGRVGKNGKPLKDKVEEVHGLKLDKYWQNDHDVMKLVQRCHDTISIFEKVLDMSQFIDYTKAKNQKLLEQLK